MPNGITEDIGTPIYGRIIATAEDIGTVLDNGRLAAWFNGTGTHFDYGRQTWIDGHDHVHLDANEGSGYHSCGSDIGTCAQTADRFNYATVEDAQVARIVETAANDATRVGYWPPMANRVPRGEWWAT